MSQGDTSHDTATAVTVDACPLSAPWAARVPGLLSIAAVPAAILVNPFFFGLAGGLLAGICLLLSPPGRRGLGLVGLIGAMFSVFLGTTNLH